jgi:preprotein translocase subunit SecG
VKRLVTVVIPAILLVGLILLSISDTNTAIADTSTPDNEVARSASTAGNYSASAAITITMTGLFNK